VQKISIPKDVGIFSLGEPRLHVEVEPIPNPTSFI